jgi:hypothetical protein
MSQQDLLEGTVSMATMAGKAGDGQILTPAGGSVASTRLAKGVYRLSADVDCWYRIGPSTVTAGAAVAGSAFLAKGEIDFVRILEDVRDDAEALQFIAAYGSGNFSIAKRG